MCSLRAQRHDLQVREAWVARAQEAQRAQPAIIFFDEIDGLAPVRCPPPAPLPIPHPGASRCAAGPAAAARPANWPAPERDDRAGVL